MNVSELRELISDVVEQKLFEFSQTEEGEEFTDRLKAVFAKQDERMANGDRGISVGELAERLGIEMN